MYVNKNKNKKQDVHELLAMREAISGTNPLRPIYETLIRLKARLEHAQAMSKHRNIGADDLVPIQMELGRIDSMRVDGKFMAEVEGGRGFVVPEGQAVLHFLLHKVRRRRTFDIYIYFFFLTCHSFFSATASFINSNSWQSPYPQDSSRFTHNSTPSKNVLLN